MTTKRKTTKKSSKSFLAKSKFSPRQLALIAALCVAIGIYVVARTFAATVAGSLEGEAMTLPASGGSVATDTTAVGGQALKLTSLGAATGTLATTAPGTTVVLRAKGTQCQGAPQARITLDGKDAVLASISATSWTSYTATVTSDAASHAVTAALTNPFSSKSKGKNGCVRELYIDQIQVMDTSTPSPAPDATIPTVSVTSPADGATVSGTTNVTVSATDNVAVTKVDFLINGNTVSTVTATPYAYTWDTTAVTNASYTLAATAYDAAGNVATSAPVAVTVNNVTPTPTPTAITPNGPSGNWSIVFDDEFSGTSLDLTKWSPNWYGEGGKMNNVGTYAANATVAGGNLVLQLSSSTAGALVHTDYKTGRYQLPIGGYTEARVYFPGSSAEPIYNWPAWWASGPSWPAAGEHDIAEGLSGKLTVNYHSPSGAHNFGAIAGTWYNAFHTYGVHRKATSADVYWDGVLVKSYPTDDNGAGEELILNVGASGSRVAQLGDAGAVKVDYVRAWNPAL